MWGGLLTWWTKTSSVLSYEQTESGIHILREAAVGAKTTLRVVDSIPTRVARSSLLRTVTTVATVGLLLAWPDPRLICASLAS